MADIERIDRALAHIKLHPELHFQESWIKVTSCGTGGCLAGLTVLQEYPDAKPIEDGTRDDVYTRVLVKGVQMFVDTEANKLLDLRRGQSSALFAPENTLGDLMKMRDMLAENPEVTGEELEEAASWWAED
jgi:hypothetical protein